MIFIIVLLYITIVNSLKKELVSFKPEPPPENLVSIYKTRCSRRFTPGNCVDPVQPVWTFNFETQNCTERLGCRNPVRTNRFLSYEDCIKGCKILIDLYLQIMAFEDRNDTRYILRDPSKEIFPIRRGDESEAVSPDLGPPNDFDPDTATMTSKYLYEDLTADGEKTPVDEDYIDSRLEFLDDFV